MCHALAHILFLDVFLEMLIPPISLQLFHLSADIFLSFVIHLKYPFFHVFLTVNQCRLWSVISYNLLFIPLSHNGLPTLTCGLLKERNQVLRFIPEQLSWELLLSVYYILDYALGPFEYSFSSVPLHPLWTVLKVRVNLGFEKLRALFSLTQLGSAGAEI